MINVFLLPPEPGHRGVRRLMSQCPREGESVQIRTRTLWVDHVRWNDPEDEDLDEGDVRVELVTAERFRSKRWESNA